jgi:hypothetical protein
MPTKQPGTQLHKKHAPELARAAAALLALLSRVATETEKPEDAEDGTTTRQK